MTYIYHRYDTLYLPTSIFTIWETFLQWLQGHCSLLTGCHDICGGLCPWDVALGAIHSPRNYSQWVTLYGHQLSVLDFSVLRGKWPFWHGCVRSLCDPSAADTQLGQVFQDRWESPWCEPTLPTSPLSVPWIPVPELCTLRKVSSFRWPGFLLKAWLGAGHSPV